jgi:hypothetical protein
MINVTKRLLSKFPVPRGLIFIRFPWSIVSIPLILLGWYHFSDRSQETGRPKGVETADMMAGSFEAFEWSHQKNANGAAPGRIVTASAINAEIATDTGVDADDSTTATDPSGTHDAETRCRAKVVGAWEDDYQGKRHLTVNADGSGTMVVELDGIGKKLFAARLAFDLEWSVADGRIVMKTLGGEPKSKVQMVLKLYGNEADYKILELTDERMLLLDGDGKTRFDWRRPGATAAE